MHPTIETAPRDGNVIIIEDDASGTSDVAHWSAEAGEWVGGNGEPSRFTPTHWHPMSRDEYLQEDEGSSNPSQVGPSASQGRRYRFFGDVIARAMAAPVTVEGFEAQTASIEAKPALRARLGFAASLITAILIVATLIGLYFEQETQLPSQDSRETNSLALQQQAEPYQASTQAGAQDAAQVKQAVEASTPQARQFLEKEQRPEVLANELAEARRAIEGLNLQLQAGAARAAQSPEQEREKTAALAQEAAAARQELTTSTSTHRQALDEERASRAALASELATARREIETQAAQLRKASEEETGQLRQAEAATSTQSLEQEREKTAALAQEAAAARQELATSTATHRQALDEERARSAALASELATAQREIETQAAQLRKASEEAEQLRQAEAAKSAQSLEQEREKTAALAREAAAARQELTRSTAKHRQALDEESVRRAALWSKLATAQREIETQAAQLRKASEEETGGLKQAEAATSTQSLEQEREKTAALAQEVAAARQELTTSTATHRQALDEERARSAALASERAMARGEIETQVTLLRKAGDDAVQLKQAAEGAMAKLRQPLQQERDSTEAMARDLEAVRRTIDTRDTLKRAVNSQGQVTQAVEAAVSEQPAAAVSQAPPEVARLMARARALLGQGNISAARIVLARAAEMGSALATFTLAETYDPVVLSTWGTHGTPGDATKARELYAKSLAGGIQEAKDRLSVLDQ